MIKKEIYPKTQRVRCDGDKVYITEKLDGSNLVIFKKNDKLYFAQRKNIICIDEIAKIKARAKNALFIYPFINQKIPSFIGMVPEVAELNVIPTKEHLDSIYEKYAANKNRNVEGFIVNYKNIITKYVRMKNGKLQEHFDRGE